MANNLSQRTWVLDTASSNPVKKGRVWVTDFVFTGYTGEAASKAILQDSRGLAIATLEGSVGGPDINFPIGGNRGTQFNDLKLTTIDSGKVLVRTL